MNNPVQPQQTPRRQIGLLGTWNTTQLDYRSPYTITFWSIAYGGLGHILLDQYFKGYILLLGEIFLNFASHLNDAIYYSIMGQFDLAKQTINTRWLLLYLTVYCFAIYDSYRETILINNTYRLADRENAEIKSFKMSSNSFVILSKISPYLATSWSAILPGTGSFLIQRMNRAFFLMILWVATAYLSGVFTSINNTFALQFELAKQTLNIQWFLNIPSLWFFGIYESYSGALENNKLARRELMQFLQKNYQSPNFIMP